MKRLLISLIVGVGCAGNAIANDGKQLYEDYKCAGCHGTDGKTGKSSNIPKLAGMNVTDLQLGTKRSIESKSHDEVMKGCGEIPNPVQIKQISEYLSALPH